mgnify:CR=1 FL=1|jgi:hypothetical protein|tara:strand:- start:4754 stop:5044 length:291 start_codon:yes stop_codon:yes gene_type:complete
MEVGLTKQLNSFLNRMVKRKYPVNEINVSGRDIGNGNFDYTVWVHPTWEGHDRLQSDDNFEEELFKYIKETTEDGIMLFREYTRGHYFNKVDWFWD